MSRHYDPSTGSWTSDPAIIAKLQAVPVPAPVEKKVAKKKKAKKKVTKK